MQTVIDFYPDISLTRFMPGDKGNLIQYLNNPTIYRNTANIPQPYTEADADWWLNHVQEVEGENGLNANWVIRHPAHGLIGGIGCFFRHGVGAHADEIGYWLAEPFWGQGIATAAVRAFCTWLFEQRSGLVRIEARVYQYNPASARVLEKAGFMQEGYLRKAIKKDGELVDAWLYARIR